MNKNTSIIIQGPLHEHSVSNIEIYKKYGDIIFVSWADGYLQNIEIIKTIKNSGAFLLLLDKPRLRENRHNIGLQSYSTYNGLLLSNYEYAIKLRSDEKYSNLEPLIDKIYNTDKIITSNIFFRKHTNYPLHISDHIIAGKTEKLLSIFQNCISFCLNPKKWIIQNQQQIKNIPINFVPEQLITMSSIPIFNTEKHIINFLDKNSCYDYMINNFDIINIENLGDFIISYSLPPNKRYYTDNLWSFANRKTDVINSISEYL